MNWFTIETYDAGFGLGVRYRAVAPGLMILRPFPARMVEHEATYDMRMGNELIEMGRKLGRDEVDTDYDLTARTGMTKEERENLG